MGPRTLIINKAYYYYTNNIKQIKKNYDKI